MMKKPDIQWCCDISGRPVGFFKRKTGAPPCECQGCRAHRICSELETALREAMEDSFRAIHETGQLRSGITKAIGMNWPGGVCPDDRLIIADVTKREDRIRALELMCKQAGYSEEQIKNATPYIEIMGS